MKMQAAPLQSHSEPEPMRKVLVIVPFALDLDGVARHRQQLAA